MSPDRPDMTRNDSRGGQKRTGVIGSWLITFGVGLLVCVGGVFAYGYFETWAARQLQVLVSDQAIWPESVPLTPLPIPSPGITPSPAPLARIEIPAIGVNRAVVTMGLVDRGGQLEWDTDSLFATASRPDLVGHLEGTGNLGQSGNIVLAGHNYNRGAFNWLGVFYSLGALQPGDLVHLVDENGVQFTYQVEQVDQLPWPAPSADVALAHMSHLAPSPDEKLTLLTCSGGTIAPFPARVYVTARRVLNP